MFSFSVNPVPCKQLCVPENLQFLVSPWLLFPVLQCDYIPCRFSGFQEDKRELNHLS